MEKKKRPESEEPIRYVEVQPDEYYEKQKAILIKYHPEAAGFLSERQAMRGRE